MNLKRVLTNDGSYTLYNPDIGEHYHSINGAIQESKHVFIETGLRFCKKELIKVLEIGFGTGLNALLTLLESQKEKKEILYHGIELFPVPENILLQLDYSIAGKDADKVFRRLHSCAWGKDHKINEWFSFKKIEADISNYLFMEKFDVVYFDAFGPEKQASIWTYEIFRKLYNAMNPNGLLTTFSSKGDVKRAMREAGFKIKRLPGPPGKRHILRARKEIL